MAIWVRIRSQRYAFVSEIAFCPTLDILKIVREWSSNSTVYATLEPFAKTTRSSNDLRTRLMICLLIRRYDVRDDCNYIIVSIDLEMTQ